VASAIALDDFNIFDTRAGYGPPLTLQSPKWGISRPPPPTSLPQARSPDFIDLPFFKLPDVRRTKSAQSAM
jgi:hypothetical protein